MAYYKRSLLYLIIHQYNAIQIRELHSISLFSNQYYKIVNKSTVPVEFSWRAFSTDREEGEKKGRLNMQLSQEESEERGAINESTIDESANDSLNSDDSYDEGELQ